MSYEIVLQNRSPLPRTHWSDPIALPYSAEKQWPAECTFLAGDGNAFRAVRGEDLAKHSVFYRILATIGGKQTMHGKLVLDMKHPDAGMPFTLHPWVTDNLDALVPKLAVRKVAGGPIAIGFPIESPVLLSESAAHMRWQLKLAIPDLGLIQIVIADVLSGDPVIPIYSEIVWSDRRVSARLTEPFSSIGVVLGEQFYPDFAFANYFQQARTPDGQNAVELLANSALKDGCPIPFRGRVLAFKGPPTPDASSLTDVDLPDINNLEAGKGGPIQGMMIHWPNKFLACGNTPKVPLYGDSHTIRRDVERIELNRIGLGAPRPLICSTYPGQTGDQPDFGCTRGGEVTSFAGSDEDTDFFCQWLWLARYAVDGDIMRGGHHYESNGQKLRASDYPGWETWGVDTGFWFWDRSQNTLWKDGGYAVANPLGNYIGHDDEHYSINTMLAYYALTGDPLVANHLEHLIETDQASAFNRRGWVGAARAEGRRMAVWANMAMLTTGDQHKKVVSMLDQRILLSDQSGMLAVQGPVKTVAVHGPDPRKPLFDVSGNLLPTWCLWEHALHVIGLYLAIKSGQVTDLPRAQKLMTTLSTTMLQQGFFFSQGKTFIVADMEYVGDGSAIELSASKVKGAVTGVQSYGMNISADTNAGDVRSWTLVGILAAREWLRVSRPDLAERADMALAALRIDLKNPTSVAEAQWWAMVNA